MLQTKEKMTVREATQKWVYGFNAINMSLFAKAFGDYNIDLLHELTMPTVGENVWSYERQEFCEIVLIEDGYYILKDNSGEEFKTTKDKVLYEHDSLFPMWGTIWSFDNVIDEEWAKKNIDVMSECGFRIYEDLETGDLYFGIDGAGYDFYESHWIPLYRARGLMWHK